MKEHIMDTKTLRQGQLVKTTEKGRAWVVASIEDGMVTCSNLGVDAKDGDTASEWRRHVLLAQCERVNDDAVQHMPNFSRQLADFRDRIGYFEELAEDGRAVINEVEQLRAMKVPSLVHLEREPMAHELETDAALTAAKPEHEHIVRHAVQDSLGSEEERFICVVTNCQANWWVDLDEYEGNLPLTASAEQRLRFHLTYNGEAPDEELPVIPDADEQRELARLELELHPFVIVETQHEHCPLCWAEARKAAGMARVTGSSEATSTTERTVDSHWALVQRPVHPGPVQVGSSWHDDMAERAREQRRMAGLDPDAVPLSVEEKQQRYQDGHDCGQHDDVEPAFIGQTIASGAEYADLPDGALVLATRGTAFGVTYRVHSDEDAGISVRYVTACRPNGHNRIIPLEKFVETDNNLEQFGLRVIHLPDPEGLQRRGLFFRADMRDAYVDGYRACQGVTTPRHTPYDH